MNTRLFKNIPVEIPSIPNFIKVGGNTFPIKEFTEEELKDIGEEWTKKLIEKAKKKDYQLTLQEKLQ